MPPVSCQIQSQTGSQMELSMKNDPFEGLVVPLHLFEDLSLEVQGTKWNSNNKIRQKLDTIINFVLSYIMNSPLLLKFSHSNKYCGHSCV